VEYFPVAPVESLLPEAESRFSAPMKTASQPSLVKEKKRAGRGVAKLQNSVVGGAVFRPVAVEEWLERLNRECRSGRKNMLFWVDAHNQGAQLMTHRDTIGQKDMRDKFTALFSLVSQVKDEASIGGQCVEILAKLAEIEKTP